MSTTSCCHSYGHRQEYISDPRLGLLLSQIASAPETMMGPLGQRKRPCRTPNEIQEGLRDLQRLKRLRIDEAGVVGGAEEETPCQALILRPVAPDELVFRMAVGIDFANSTLGQLLLRKRTAADVQVPSPRSHPIMTESKEEMGSERRDVSVADDNDAHDKQLALYQAPPASLAELFREASYLDEHQMALD